MIGNVYNCGTNPYTDLYHMPFILKLDRTRWSGSGFDWTVIPTPGPGSAPRSEDYNVIENAVPNPALADLDGDGFKEILFPSYDGKMHAYWLDKTEHGSWPYTIPTSGAPGDDFRFASEPVVADLDNDGHAEVIFTSWPKKATNGTGELFILDYLGNLLSRTPLPTVAGTWNGGLGAPTLANIDADPDLEVVVGTVASGVVAYDLPNSANARVLWGTGRGSYRRTGSLADAASADLSITKTDGQTTVLAGTPVTYTITVTNNGPGSVAGAAVTDNFPAAVLSVSWSCTASAGASCGATSGSGNILQTVNVPPGGTATYTAVATTSPSATGSLSNTATVAVPAGMTDPVPANNNATDTDTVLPAADLSITKSDGRTNASPGQSITYTIVVSNAGPNTANGATVTDTVPASLMAAAWTCAGASGGACTPGGSGSITDTVILPVGGSVTYTLTGTLSANPSNLRNTATVAVPSGMGDPNPANNTATDDDALICFGETVIVPDGRVTSTTIAGSTTAWFTARLRIGNSYSLEFKNASGDSTPPGTLTVYSGDDGCTGTSTMSPRNTAAIDPGAGAASQRMSFTASGTEPFFRAKLDNSLGTAIPLSFTWSDTTMYSPAWSTNGAFNTYYSFLNTTGASLTATLTLSDTTGAVLSTFVLPIPAGQAASANTASLAVTRNRTGTARFTHDGPPGAVTAEAAIANFSISPAYVQPVQFKAVREAR